MPTNYQSSSIETLDYFEHIRRYPGMYIGSKDEKGLLHCVKELVSNSIDEYLNGAGTCIKVTLHMDGSITIKDDGRGIPHGIHPSGCSILQACYGIANTGGKFNNATGETGYNTSGGEHGTGCKAVNALSKKMIASTSRDGIIEIVEFSKGKFISYNRQSIAKDITGVEVTFYPDETIFETIKFDYNKIKTMLQEFSFLCSGLMFKLVEEGIESSSIEEFYSTKGLFDYANYLNKNKPFLFEPIYLNAHDGSYQVEAIIGYTDGYGSSTKLYTNNIPQEKGTHLTGFKTAWTSTLNSWAKDNKILKDKDPNFTGSDLEEGQILILNFKMIDPVFKGQNKEELSSSEGRTYVQRLIGQELKSYLDTHSKDIEVLLDKAIMARKAREAAKKAREATRNNKTKKEGLKAKMELSDKLIPCTSKDVTKNNLLIVEGLSAGSSALEARNPQHDSIMMLRGKCLSVLKCDTEKVLANKEYNDIISTIGAGFGDNFDVNKMQYNKIVITSDQDSDGANIELLLITFFYTYMRPLVEAGKLYRAMTPLYIVDFGKEKREYFYSESEFAKFRETNPSGYELIRAKGLGALNQATLKEVCFDIEKYKQITISDVEETYKLLEILMGKSVEPRKQFIYDNATEIGMSF